MLRDKENLFPFILDVYRQASTYDDQLTYARILGMLGNSVSWKVLKKAIESYTDWDDGWNYRGMRQFGMSSSYLDGLIIAFGRLKRLVAIKNYKNFRKTNFNKRIFSLSSNYNSN